MGQEATSDKARLKIAVVGAGKIGSAFAFQLARADHDVTVVARPGSSRLQQLQCEQGIVLDSNERVNTQVTERLDEDVAFDLVVVTVRDAQVNQLVPALKRSVARHLHFMFVSFDPERLAVDLGADRCSFGMPAIMAWLDSSGRLHQKISSSQKTLHGDQRWVDLFVAAGIPSALEIKMELWLRSHVPLTVGMESVCVVGERRSGGATWREAKRIARGVKGGFAIVQGLGYPLYPNSKRRLNSAPTPVVTLILWIVSRVKSFRALLSQGGTEAEELTDTMIGAARIHTELASAVEAAAAMRPHELLKQPTVS